MDAALSLKASSSMIGALRMEQICEDLEQALVMADRDNAVTAGQEAQEHLPELAAAIAARQARGPAQAPRRVPRQTARRQVRMETRPEP